MGMLGMESQREGTVTRGIERVTSKLPSTLFLWSGVASILSSLALHLSGRQKKANFVATWVPTLLLLGVYNKIVKVAGHDISSQRTH